MSALKATPTHITPGSKKDQVIHLLKNGCKPSEVAAAVGCDISYVSQILNPDTTEGQEIVLYRIKQLSESAGLDKTYDDLEKKLLEGLELKLQQGTAFLKVETILRAIQTINGAKRRNANNTEQTGTVTNIVNLIAPTILMKRYQVNQKNEVISVGAQPLVAMAASEVMNKLKNNQKLIGDSSEVNHGERKERVGSKESPLQFAERVSDAEVALDSF